MWDVMFWPIVACVLLPWLLVYLGLHVVRRGIIFIEPKPGIPPSPSHLAKVIAQMKAQKIKAIFVEPYHNRKIAEKVAQSTGAKVVDFAQFPGALPNTETYVKLIDALVNNLAAALK